MAITYDTAMKAASMTAKRDEAADGTLEIMASDDTVLVAFGLSATGGSISGDTWTLAFDASTVAATASGTAAKAQIKDSAGTARITGITAGTSGSDINLDHASITSGLEVAISNATVQHVP